MLQHQSVGFQLINPAPMPPHLESARNLLFGKSKSNQPSDCQYQYRSRTQLEIALKVQVIDIDKEYQKFSNEDFRRSVVFPYLELRQ